MSEIDDLRAALTEATTNGEWTEGEQRGNWVVSKEVYETMRDALAAHRPCPDKGDNEWPAGISDGLVLPCHDCGGRVRFDYHVTDEFWRQHVTAEARRSVVCLPCLDRRCGGIGLAQALEEVQWTGTGHTVVLKPSFVHAYEPRADTPSPDNGEAARVVVLSKAEEVPPDFSVPTDAIVASLERAKNEFSYSNLDCGHIDEAISRLLALRLPDKEEDSRCSLKMQTEK